MDIDYNFFVMTDGAGNLEESNSDLEDIAEIDEETASVNSRVLLNGGSINHCKG